MPSTNEQWSRALGLANEVRRERGRLKRQLADGSVSIVAVLADPPRYAETATVRQLLLALPNVGPATASRLLTHCQIAGRKTVAGLSDRQRAALIKTLSSRST
jgi:hypothetical protein